MTDHMLRRARDMWLTLDSITESWGPYDTESRAPERPQRFLKPAHMGTSLLVPLDGAALGCCPLR